MTQGLVSVGLIAIVCSDVQYYDITDDTFKIFNSIKPPDANRLSEVTEEVTSAQYSNGILFKSIRYRNKN